MKRGHLSTYFKDIAAKRLSAVEADPSSSNQHEFNGSTPLKRLFGIEKTKIRTSFIHLDDQFDKNKREEGSMTWYDSRENHPTRSERRLFYPTTAVSETFQTGDLIIFCRRTDGGIMTITAHQGTTIERQLLWLFNVDEDLGSKFEVKEIDQDDREMDFASRAILDALEIEITDVSDEGLDEVIKKYGVDFPSTADFSDFARSKAAPISALESPDEALMLWMTKEEELFRALEKHIISKRIKEGFDEGNDVDSFISFSLSVQNRRKSRAGFALENHLECIFKESKIMYSRGKETENKAKPDFLFPGVSFYHDSSFPIDNLSMLGVKTTCKDRWRQVMSEAAKIPLKHLLTLETSISTNQTDEMRANDVQLVIPSSLHSTYQVSQQSSLMHLYQFLILAQERQTAARP